mmetsp:Transcript_12407/g.25388  ORF Transcript_12407/g.25388 Transcript_12407/m.25388 type:complete len:599 (+) Transcript_12407:193-1989(+)
MATMAIPSIFILSNTKAHSGGNHPKTSLVQKMSSYRKFCKPRNIVKWLTSLLFFLLLVRPPPSSMMMTSIQSSRNSLPQKPQNNNNIATTIIASSNSIRNYSGIKNNATNPPRSKLNITLTFQAPRHDRMGSRIQFPLVTWAYARLQKYHFCTPYDHMAQRLDFNICPTGFVDGTGLFEGDGVRRLGFDPNANDDDLLLGEEGDFKSHLFGSDDVIYLVNHVTNILDIMKNWEFINDDDTHVRNSNTGKVEGTLWTESTVREWKRMILNAPVSSPFPAQNSTDSKQNRGINFVQNSNINNGSNRQEWVWIDPNAIHIALHVRRGDITPEKRWDVWIGDDQFIALIEMVKRYIQIVRRGDNPGNEDEVKTEVHLFSEAYGTTNWGKYGNLITRLHLAPKGSRDVGLNIRDWKHFVTADVLIVGGTFSRIPAYGRIDDDGNGETIVDSDDDNLHRHRYFPPMTLCHRQGDTSYCRKNWVRWKYGRNRDEVIVEFPSNVSMVAMSPETMERQQKEEQNPISGLCKECIVASVPGAFHCKDRIAKYILDDSMTLYEAQSKVGDQYWKCKVCHPDSCRSTNTQFNESFTIRNGWEMKVSYGGR